MAESGKDMTLIVTSKVYDRLVEEHGKRLSDIIRKENVTFMKLNDRSNAISPSMTITDVFTYIYFFNKDGVYDYKIIIGFEDVTRMWAKELYKYYKKQSVAVEE
ncbi:MAG: DUF1724 domain-containing protein [Methanosarcinales archaeon]|jgi:predicted transcriptional regulator|nr:DUF1724 domain-containing protein [Methanosarcinales archaeon]